MTKDSRRTKKRKAKKQNHIPLSAAIDDRNFKIYIQESRGDPKLKNALLDEVLQGFRKAKKFTSGRIEGSISGATKQLIELVKNNRHLSAKELFNLASQSAISDMKFSTFRNHVSIIRKQYPKIKTSTV